MSQINHVVRVAHNLKGGGETELGQRTLIVGPNGSGKSAIINAVELALTGKASDIAGRDVVSQGAALASLANGTGAWSEVALDDGSTARWEITRKGSTVSRPRRSGPEGVMPLRHVLNELTGSAERARKFLLRHACEGIDNKAITAKLDQDTLGRYQRLTDVRLDPIDNLLAVSALAGKSERNAKKHAAGARDAEQAASAGLARRPSEGAIEAAKAAREIASDRLFHAKSVLQRASAAASDSQPDLNALAATWDALKQSIAEVQGEIEGLRAALSGMAFDDKGAHRETLIAMLGLMETVWTEGPCLACGQEFDRVRWANHVAQVREIDNAAKEKNRARDAEERRIRADLADREALIVKAQLRLGHVEEQAAKVTQAEVIDVEEARLAVEAATLAAARADEEHTTLRESAACWERVKRSQSVRREYEREAIGWGMLDQQCRALVSELVEDAVATFSRRVQRFLPDADRFTLKFDKNAVRYGLLRDGEIHTALSGAEWARVSTALAAACTPAEAAVPLLVPEDRAWDPKTLRGVLQGLNDYRGQVIVATTVKPFRGVPAGWTLVEVGT